MAQNRKRKVELLNAYFFICPECGTTNYGRGCTNEMAQEDIDQLKIDLGIELDEPGEFYFLPEEVACEACLKEFDVEPGPDDIDQK